MIITIIKTTSEVGDGDGDGMHTGWPVMLGVVEVGVVNTCYGRGARLHCTQGLAGRGD